MAINSEGRGSRFKAQNLKGVPREARTPEMISLDIDRNRKKTTE